MTGTGMYNHIFGFVYNKKPLVFIKNIQRDILRKDIRHLHIRDCKDNLILRLNFIVGFDLAVIYKNSPVFYEFLDIGTRKVGTLFCQITVNSYIAVFFSDIKI